MLRIDSVAGPAGADRENSPRSFVTAMTGVPGTVTVAPATGCPEAELVTFPVMGRCWASAAPMPTLKLSASVMNQVRPRLLRTSLRGFRCCYDRKPYGRG